MKNRYLWLTLLAALNGSVAVAHEGHTHLSPSVQPSETPDSVEEKHQVEITADYNLAIAPLFQRACADCHSGDTVYPWYAMIPGIKQMIRQDIDDARRHIEISNGYPFQSHATPIDDLQAVEKVVREGSMPPLRYQLMHRGARLTEMEKKRIIEWAKRSRELLHGPVPGS